MATLKLYLKKKKLSNGEFPIYLRVTKDRTSKLISTSLSCELSQWNENKSEFRKTYKDYIQKNAILTTLKSRAEKIISDALAIGRYRCTHIIHILSLNLFLSFIKEVIKII